ncbi:MAG: helix-turn-helix transcriptional regulator [Bacteroidetes bacterium]|nr:helix-turn-helix transcriptional regulator [Bacteroidota bacterium]
MKKLTTLGEHLDKRYGKRGTKRRDDFERGFEAFKLGVMIRQAREELHLSQSELAAKANTNKSYISRIENDASDIRLSTLIKIVEQGLGGKLHVSVEL